MMDRLKAWLADWPTTQTRILFTLGLVAGTALVAWYCFVQGIRLDDETWSSWLIFLAVMSGIDAAQWTMKRRTAWKPPQTASEVQTGEPVRPPSAGAPMAAPAPLPQPPMVPADGSEEG